ncbi:MAG TPA: ATP-binding protein [Blastocatellia bacterium]|nr:ATP-binding protein [Blastocatellia bacterium]
MINDGELEVLLNDLESDRVERKASSSDRDRLCEAICAFANDLPGHDQAGVLFVGVRDDGSCANLPITDDLLLKLSHLRSDGNILPFPAMAVQKRTVSSCELAAVIVEPADAPPVRYKGRVWVRVGPRRAIATAEEERRLAEKRRSRDLPFDIQQVAAATLKDLDLEFFRRVYLPSALPPDVISQNQRTEEQQLASLRFLSTDATPTPTVLGILVAGKDPRQFVPGAYIQFLRIEGTKLTDPIKTQKEIDGTLPDVLRILDETLETHISVASDFSAGPLEIKHPDYPVVALQQLCRNAVMHRSYDGTNAPARITWFTDRVEIQNPGGPFGQVTRSNFGREGITDYRNPHLAEVMKSLGYVQRFGYGIPMAREELAKNGNPALEFTVEDAHVLATIRRRS